MCDTREAQGKRRRGRPEYNMTQRCGKIAKWTGENEAEIMLASLDRAIDWGHWCEVLHVRVMVIPDGTAEEEE